MDLGQIELVTRERKLLFSYRPNSAGDRGVIAQVFQHHEYEVNQWEQGRRLLKFHEENKRVRPSLIIDAGANIGASAVYFSNTYKDAFVVAVEPEAENVRLLEINTAAYTSRLNLHAALASEDGRSEILDPGLSNWGFRTKPVGADSQGRAAVASISVNTILASTHAKGKTPLILKIDIEGAEDEVFSRPAPWLRDFALVVIELHDWMLPFSGSSRNFLRAIVDLDFDVLQRGENMFFFNRRLLASV